MCIDLSFIKFTCYWGGDIQRIIYQYHIQNINISNTLFRSQRILNGLIFSVNTVKSIASIMCIVLI